MTARVHLLILALPFMVQGVLAGEYLQTSNGVTYYIESTYKYTWYDALMECTYRNMTLYTIASQAQFDDLAQLLIGDKFKVKPPHLWIGAVGVNRRFLWIKTRKPVITSMWGIGNPDNYGQREHCVHFWENMRYLADGDCLSGLGYVCEAESEVEILSQDDDSSKSGGKYKGLIINFNQIN